MSCPAETFETVAREINIDVNDFTLDGEQSSPFNLALQTDRKEKVGIKGLFSLSPFNISLEAELNNIDTAAYVPYYEEVYRVPIEGRIDLSGKIASNPEQPFLLTNGQFKLHDAYMAFNQKEGLEDQRKQHLRHFFRSRKKQA